MVLVWRKHSKWMVELRRREKSRLNDIGELQVHVEREEGWLSLVPLCRLDLGRFCGMQVYICTTVSGSRRLEKICVVCCERGFVL